MIFIIFKTGLITLVGQSVSTLRVKLWKVVMNSKIVMFLSFAPFSKNLDFWGCDILSHCTDPINPIFAVVVGIYKIQVFDKASLTCINPPMITEKLLFFYFHGNRCQENKFLHEYNTTYQPKISLKKWSQTGKESSRKVVIKVHILFPIFMTKTAAIGSKHIKSYFSEFLMTFDLSRFYLFFKILYFLNSLDN